MADYNHKQSIPSIEKEAHSCASGAASAPLVYKATYQPPLQLELVDEVTGEVKECENDIVKQRFSDIMALRYTRQTSARKILYGFEESTQYKANGHIKHHQTCYCNHVPISQKVDLLHNPNSDRINFSGLSTCGSRATCPICDSVIASRRANQLRAAFDYWLSDTDHDGKTKERGYVSLLTFTVPHTAGDNISELVTGIRKAQNAFFNGAPWKKKKDKYGIEARARAFEIRIGVNGWHPHFHILLFSKKPLPTTQLEIGNKYRTISKEQHEDWDWFLERWQSMCLKQGLSMPNDYGMDLRNGDNASEYINKYGSDGQVVFTKDGRKVINWDLADELVKGGRKDGRKDNDGSIKSMSPFQLLDVYSDKNASKSAKNKSRLHFIDYARAIKNQSLFKWSKGADQILHFDDKTDTEILIEENEISNLLTQLSVYDWRCVLKHGSRDQLVQVAHSGSGVKAILAYVKSCTDIESNKGKDDFFAGSTLPVNDCPVDDVALIECDLSQNYIVDTAIGFKDFSNAIDNDENDFIPLSDDLIADALNNKKADFNLNDPTIRHYKEAIERRRMRKLLLQKPTVQPVKRSNCKTHY